MFSVVKWYILGVIAASFVSLAGIVLIIWKTAPETAPKFLIALFFLALFIFIWSATILIIFGIKSRFARSRLFDEAAYEPLFYDSLLQGLLAAGVIMTVVLIKKLF